MMFVFIKLTRVAETRELGNYCIRSTKAFSMFFSSCQKSSRILPGQYAYRKSQD